MAGEISGDSFEEYKKYLQESINYLDIPRPPRIMSPYNLFYFQRQIQNKSKGKKDIANIAEEWQQLSDGKKEYYVKIYEIRKKQYNDLKMDYDVLSNKSKSSNAYICYFKQQYPIISEQNKNIGYEVVTKIIAADWKKLNGANKLLYDKKAMNEKEKKNQIESEKKQLIQNYQVKIKEFKRKLGEDKGRIMRKYGRHGKKCDNEENKQNMEQKKKIKRQFCYQLPSKQSQQPEKYCVKIQDNIKLQKSQPNDKEIVNIPLQLGDKSKQQQKQIDNNEIKTTNKIKKRNRKSNRQDIKIEQNKSDKLKIQQQFNIYAKLSINDNHQLDQQKKDDKIITKIKQIKKKQKNIVKRKTKNLFDIKNRKQIKFQSMIDGPNNSMN